MEPSKVEAILKQKAVKIKLHDTMGLSRVRKFAWIRVF